MATGGGRDEARQGAGRGPGAVLALVVALAAGTVALVLASGGATPPGRAEAAALPVLGGVLFGASLLVVRYRHGREVDGVTLTEAALAPLLFAFPSPVVVGTVVAAETAVALVRGDGALKGAFNVAQWAFAAAAGALVVERAPLPAVPTVVSALVVVMVANNLAFTAVMALVGRQTPRTALRGLAPVIVPGWLIGFGVNLLLGLLFVAAYDGTPLAVLLFPVPVLVAHLAYRGYAAVRTDRQRLAGLHRASRQLATPLDPVEALPGFLQELAETFSARVAVLLRDGRVHRYEAGAEPAYLVEEPGPLGRALLALHEPVRTTRTDDGALGDLLRDTDASDLLAAPLLQDDDVVGALAVLDRGGVEGLPSGELDVLAAAAREAAATLARGRLLADVLEERRKLDELVTTTSDGILSLDPQGVVLSWNPALEHLTGLAADAVVGVPGALVPLGLRRTDGAPVALTGWADDADRPAELVLDTRQGTRRVVCSYSRAAGTDTLVVVARDVTPAQEFAALRDQFARLVEAEAAQRLVVEHLQQAVMPPLPALAGAELGVRYVASDPSEPTGGDLYDCQLLPDGTVHLAVVDVLGHGVQATQHALSVAHTLRTVVLDGTPLAEVVARADVLLGRQDPDLVATVVLGRYTPATGALQLAGGGHPPPIVVTAAGTARQVELEGGALGWPLAGSDGVVETCLEPGDALVLYTDGLVEARKDIVQGLAELAVLAGTLVDLPAGAFAQALVDDALRGADRRDDTLALVLRRDPGPEAAEARWQLEPASDQVGATRRDVTGWLTERGLPHDDVALVVGELLANAVVGARTTVLVTARLEQRPEGVHVHLEVCDDGPGFEAVPPQPRAVEERGRGLLIVRALARDVLVHSTSAGTSVSAVVVLDGARSHPDGRGGVVRTDQVG
ncbi:MAG: domain S-box-containing protein [Frankiales bacterium]|nr:domain S-box-containing protein [Frankiales bacterium]